MAAPDKDATISWAHTIATRDGTLAKDAKMVNCFIEKTDNGAALVKRPGTFYYSSGNTGTPQGQFSFFGANYFIIDNVARTSASTGSTGIPIPSPAASKLMYTAISAQQAGAPSTVIQDEAGNLWTFNGSTFTKVTDANYISTSVAFGIAYLDGVYYVMRVDGQVIGSAINDPTTWPALDFAQADVTYAQGVSVLRHLNYIVAFYDQGTQVYWDANAAPNGSGIALLPVLSSSFTTGCFNARTIQEVDDMSFWVSNSKLYGRQVQMMQGLTMQPVSTPFIDKILNQTALQQISPMWSFAVRSVGHTFYVLTLPSLNVTLVYDATMQAWYTWSSVVNGVEQYFVGKFYQREEGASGGFIGDSLQDTSTGRQMILSPTTYTDCAFALPTVPINVTAVTPNYDWGTLNWKRFTAMFQQADTITTAINISYTDDDYNTFSTPRTMDLSGALKQFRNCGSSRRRAWKMQHTDATVLRLYDVKIPVTVANR